MWHTVYLHENAVSKETRKAVLISLPRTAFGLGYKIWHPASMINHGKWWIELRFPDTWTMKLVKPSGSLELGAQEFVEKIAFHQREISANINAKKPFLTVEHPEPLMPVEVEVPSDLRND